MSAPRNGCHKQFSCKPDCRTSPELFRNTRIPARSSRNWFSGKPPSFLEWCISCCKKRGRRRSDGTRRFFGKACIPLLSAASWMHKGMRENNTYQVLAFQPCFFFWKTIVCIVCTFFARYSALLSICPGNDSSNTVRCHASGVTL